MNEWYLWRIYVLIIGIVNGIIYGILGFDEIWEMMEYGMILWKYCMKMMNE